MFKQLLLLPKIHDGCSGKKKKNEEYNPLPVAFGNVAHWSQSYSSARSSNFIMLWDAFAGCTV